MQLSGKRGKKYNVSRPPLFPMVPLSNVVIDNLHRFLRVADVLIDLLIVELRRHDSIDKLKRFTCFNPEKYKHIDAIQKFVSSLGIPGYSFYIGKDSKVLKVRSLTGPEKLKVFRNIKVAELLLKTDRSEVAQIQHLWDEFFRLNQIFSKRPEDLTEDDISQYEGKAREWGRFFIGTYHDHNVTPYIHAFMNHVAEVFSSSLSMV